MQWFRWFSAAFFIVLVTAIPTRADEYRDSDWNIGLFKNCDLPVPTWQGPTRPPSVVWDRSTIDSKIQFHLGPGDMGRCSSDKNPRDGARYWERAELRQNGNFEDGYAYNISFTTIFREGFVGKRETFFQIHGWSKTCKSAPLMMLQFDWQRMRAMVLKPGTELGPTSNRGDLVSVLNDAPQIKDVRQREQKFDILYDARSKPYRLSMWLNERPLFSDEPVYTLDCVEPFLKFGIYRPGEVNPFVSSLILDDIQVDQLVINTRSAHPRS